MASTVGSSRKIRIALAIPMVGIIACGSDRTLSPAPVTPEPPTAPFVLTYTVVGTVRNANNGQAIANALIQVADVAPNVNAGKSTTTDVSGRYSIAGLQFAGFSLS